MHILITYDVSTSAEGGKRRLRRVAKACLDWGQRVQASVFECKLDPGQYTRLKAALTDLINPKTDSLRFYNLGKHWHGRVEHVGRDQSSDPDAPLIV
ncbi:CRISPR-associated endonuclease Cas2 [Mucisphaera calidilacus]|uniref:CRISPR-associated endoribonuclease Cas2 n=1 Tax=Mucisphaera calidilacus TaxID=2527982 RepID=A0A518C072_9BACT|nr:CRISPR-associated endonuclease Cas2 [Mucisphaera calidilacus]QDU72621.1 CRISPR-associated endoribonuclease Cas2 [Mucisphaera calidilacus]